MIEERRQKVVGIKTEIAALKERQSALYKQLDALESDVCKECKHSSVIYTDGHVSYNSDENDTPEQRICLGCGLIEKGERAHTADYSLGKRLWAYKVLVGRPIRRFCVSGRAGPRGTLEYETNANITFGTNTLEERMSHYWFYVEERIFRLPYASRVKAVMKVGYTV